MVSVLAAEDTILIGRVTYQEWVGYWPTSTDEPYASHIYNTPKYAVSKTLEKVECNNAKASGNDCCNFDQFGLRGVACRICLVAGRSGASGSAIG
jgi:hypothetical protein